MGIVVVLGTVVGLVSVAIVHNGVTGVVCYKNFCQSTIRAYR
jgi:hypothetical protein